MSYDDTNSMGKKSKLRKSKVNRYVKGLCKMRNLPEGPNQVTAANEKNH